MHTVQLVKKLFKNIKTKNVVKYIGLAQWALTQPKLQTQLQLCSTKQTTYYNSWTLWCITHHTSSKSDSKTASVNICEWPNSMGSECDLGNFQLSWVPDNGNIWFAECDFLLVFYTVVMHRHISKINATSKSKVQNSTFSIPYSSSSREFKITLYDNLDWILQASCQDTYLSHHESISSSVALCDHNPPMLQTDRQTDRWTSCL